MSSLVDGDRHGLEYANYARTKKRIVRDRLFSVALILCKLRSFAFSARNSEALSPSRPGRVYMYEWSDMTRAEWESAARRRKAPTFRDNAIRMWDAS